MDLQKANLGQLQYIARYTHLRQAALNELFGRVRLETGCDSEEKERGSRASNTGS